MCSKSESWKCVAVCSEGRTGAGDAGGDWDSVVRTQVKVLTVAGRAATIAFLHVSLRVCVRA